MRMAQKERKEKREDDCNGRGRGRERENGRMSGRKRKIAGMAVVTIIISLTVATRMMIDITLSVLGLCSFSRICCTIVRLQCDFHSCNLCLLSHPGTHTCTCTHAIYRTLEEIGKGKQRKKDGVTYCQSEGRGAAKISRMSSLSDTAQYFAHTPFCLIPFFSQTLSPLRHPLNSVSLDHGSAGK